MYIEFLVKNKAENYEQLKKFSEDGYKYLEEKDNGIYFIRKD